MMPESIEKVQKYLGAFFAAKYDEYFEDMKELRPERGYGYYCRSSDVTQFIRNIVHNMRDTFGDLRIPEGFPSPDALINTLKRFLVMLEEQEIVMLEIRSVIEANKEVLPIPLLEIFKINNDVKEAVIYSLSFVSGDINCSSGNIHVHDILENIFARFHIVARQLISRRKRGGVPRSTLLIEDEYDVQDLLHALLRLHFFDVRTEEYSPHYAGGNSRIDFILKDHDVAIEVKMTRDTLLDAKIGEELIIDMARYKENHRCKCLYCFVYDPGELLANPDGLVRDLSCENGELQTKVLVCPRRV